MTLLSLMVMVEASHPGPESKEFPENDTNKIRNPRVELVNPPFISPWVSTSLGVPPQGVRNDVENFDNENYFGLPFSLRFQV